MNNTTPPSSNFKKEIIIPIIVSVVGGIILTTYQFFLNEIKDKDAKPSIEQPTITQPNTPNNTAKNIAKPDEAAKQKYVAELDERIKEANRLLSKKQCDEAKTLIAQIEWQHPELDENNKLAISFDNIKKKLEAESQLCGADDVLNGIEEKLEPNARRKAIELFRNKARGMDFAPENIELVEKKPKISGDSYKITFTYELKAFAQGGTSNKVSVLCDVPIIDGKPSDNPTYRID